jgi:hypothetical protein
LPASSLGAILVVLAAASPAEAGYRMNRKAAVSTWLALGVLATVAACGTTLSDQPTPPPPATTQHAAPPAGGPSTTIASPSLTFQSSLVAVIVMENQSPGDVLDLPYLRSLTQRGAVLNNYRAVAHPSLPNYLALTSGSTWGLRDDDYHTLPNGPDLGQELSTAHIPWRAYMESMTNGCMDSPSPYAVKHNPFAYYGGSCPPKVVPFGNLGHDLSGPSAPRFVWITPNLCNDDHDCDPAVGDRWLSTVVPAIVAAPGFAEHGLLAIVWDEGAHGADQAPAVILSPDLIAHGTSSAYDHYSVLAAVEDRLGMLRLGHAGDADPLTAVLRHGS